MERIMIYPYTRAYEPYVRYAGLLENREIVSLVSSGGSGLVGRQVCSGEKELTVSKDYEACGLSMTKNSHCRRMRWKKRYARQCFRGKRFYVHGHLLEIRPV